METTNAASNALSAVLGYIGAEASTTSTFTRLLWPQRAYACVQLKDIPAMTLLLASGGPLYRSCLQVLDNAASNGLFRGKAQGHMLGTAFFPEGRETFSLYCQDSNRREASRNNLWSRVVAAIPIPNVLDQPQDTEKLANVYSGLKQVRAYIAVHQIRFKLKKLTDNDLRHASTTKPWRTETTLPSFRVYTGILVSELSAVIVAAVVFALWHSAFALLWLAPIFLKLVSAACTVERDHLSLAHLDEADEYFQVHMPVEAGRFLFIQGPPSLVKQFFTHYGHPKRDRWREVVQLTIIAAFGLLFPVSLFCSVVWMPNAMQYTWLLHQMYLVCAMYVARYVDVDSLGSTQQGLADLLTARDCNDDITLWYDNKLRIAMCATMDTKVFGRYLEAKQHVQREILTRKQFTWSDSVSQLDLLR